MQCRVKLLGLAPPKRVAISSEWVMKGAAERVAERYGLDPNDVLTPVERLLKLVLDGETGC